MNVKSSSKKYLLASKKWLQLSIKIILITKEEYDELKYFIAEHCGVEPYMLSPFLSMSESPCCWSGLSLILPFLTWWKLPTKIRECLLSSLLLSSKFPMLLYLTRRFKCVWMSVYLNVICEFYVVFLHSQA